MKIFSNKAEFFLREIPDKIFGILLYGPNQGLISLRADNLYSSWFIQKQENLDVIKIEGSDIIKDNSILIDNLNSISLIANKLIISITDGSDKLTKILKQIDFRNYTDTKIVIKNEEMGPRSSLRKLFEDNEYLASIPCYDDEIIDNISFVKDTFSKNNLSVSNSIIEEISNLLSSDRLINYQELKKLITYINDDTNILNSCNLENILNTNNDFSLENISYAVAGGSKIELIKFIKSAFRIGASPITIIRACNYHFERLLIVKQKTEMNIPIKECMNQLKPKVFFKRERAFINQVNNWNLELLIKVVTSLLKAELLCKQNLTDANLVCERSLLSISSGFRKNILSRS